MGPIYPLQVEAPYPQAESMGSTDMFMDYENCHHKSCHCANKYWLFGVYMQHDLHLTDLEIKFGEEYRNLYAEFIERGRIGIKDVKDLSPGEFNTIGLGGISSKSIFREQCDIFDKIDYWMKV